MGPAHGVDPSPGVRGSLSCQCRARGLGAPAAAAAPPAFKGSTGRGPSSLLATASNFGERRAPFAAPTLQGLTISRSKLAGSDYAEPRAARGERRTRKMASRCPVTWARAPDRADPRRKAEPRSRRCLPPRPRELPVKNERKEDHFLLHTPFRSRPPDPGGSAAATGEGFRPEPFPRGTRTLGTLFCGKRWRVPPLSPTPGQRAPPLGCLGTFSTREGVWLLYRLLFLWFPLCPPLRRSSFFLCQFSTHFPGTLARHLLSLSSQLGFQLI